MVHRKKEYILRTPDGISAGTNHCESFFSLLKRGVHGAWHNVSRAHLHRYANEFAFRWNTRALTDGERMETAVGMTSGKRLSYRKPNGSGKSCWQPLAALKKEKWLNNGKT